VLKQDVTNNTLPQVSWIVAPEAYSEHPNWPANYGAWYVDQVLQILTSNPEVWSKTVLLVNYDENDGFFDHMAPPFAPASSANGLSTVATTNEIYGGNGQYTAGEYSNGPYGLGPRVPMIVVSPWSKGGYVCSQVFDHTSVIRFIEKRFGHNHDLGESNITPWRRAVCGDLMSAFNFVNPNDAAPTLPSTDSYVPPDQSRHPDYVPLPPLVQAVPKQEPGVRPARALPYELFVRLHSEASQGKIAIRFVNNGKAGAALLVYSTNSGAAPLSYTIEAGKRLDDHLPLNANGTYDYTVYGPNGFLRRYAGKPPAPSNWWSSSEVARPEVAEAYDVANGNLQLRLENPGTARCEFTITNAYDPSTLIKRTVKGGSNEDIYLDLRAAYGWYDLTVTVDTDPTFTRRLGGHVETGRSSMSDPALGS
jgi:phospholipase C